MKKIFTIIIALLVVLVLGISMGKNIIAKTSISAGVRALTGLKLDIRSMHVGIASTMVNIEGLQLYNPKGFQDPLMVDIPQIYVDYDLGAFLRKEIHLERVRLNLKEFVVVKNEKGELNLDSLKVVQAKQAPAEKKPAGVQPEMRIDVLELIIGKVIYKDYSSGGRPSVREFNVNINERYENITNPNALAQIIIVKALMNTTIGSLANFDLGPLKTGVTDTLKSATAIAGDTAAMAVDATKEITSQAKDTVGKVGDVGKEVGGVAQDAVKETTQTLKKILPFGKK